MLPGPGSLLQETSRSVTHAPHPGSLPRPRAAKRILPSPGDLGGTENMYEPAWYPEKTTAAVAEAAAAGTSVAGLLWHQLLHRSG
jgi:hypothetical protein